MRRLKTSAWLGLLLAAGAAGVWADDTGALIALDKQWGEAGTRGDTTAAGALLGDNLVSVSDSGVRDRAGELADNKPAPPGTVYEPTDYKVTFLDPDTAIMTHGTHGAEAHYSLHVWSRKGGAWKVIATSTTPAKAK
jgi:hypothetical protein